MPMLRLPRPPTHVDDVIALLGATASNTIDVSDGDDVLVFIGAGDSMLSKLNAIESLDPS